MKFRTISGSIYTIDTVNKKWGRSDNPNSPELRSLEGDYLSLRCGTDSEHTVKIGSSVSILCPPFVEDAIARAIITTKVVEIIEA